MILVAMWWPAVTSIYTLTQTKSSVLLYLTHTVSVCVCMCRNVGVCVQQAGQCRGGGYPVTAWGKQYYRNVSYATILLHTQKLWCSGACRWLYVLSCVCSCIAGVYACVCFCLSLRWTDIPGITSCPQGLGSNACDEGHCAPCTAS